MPALPLVDGPQPVLPAVEAGAAVDDAEPQSGGAIRRVTHQRSPRGGRLPHVVEDTRMDDLDDPHASMSNRNIERSAPSGQEKPAITAMRAP
jgi:hypothetical protein